MFVRRSTRFALLVACGVLAGCGEAPPAPTDAEAARGHLTAVLDAWKSGGARPDVSNSTPPVHVLDRDWDRGLKLTEYALDGDGQPLGAGVQWAVALNLVDEKGKTVKKKVAYVVNTGDVISVARQDVDF